MRMHVQACMTHGYAAIEQSTCNTEMTLEHFEVI